VARLGSYDGTIDLWNLETGEAQPVLYWHGGKVSALAVLPDGWLASGSNDRTVRVWRQQQNKWTQDVAFIADSAVSALAYAASKGILAVGDHSGRLHFLRLEGAPSRAASVACAVRTK
jgi:WD40 repeat protein